MYRITNSNFGSADFARTTHTAILPPDVPFDAVFDPYFWSTVARKIRIGDKIEVSAEDGSYYAELIVTNCSPQWAKVKPIIDKIDLSDNEAAPQENDKFEVKWRGRYAKWSVLHGSRVLKENLEAREDADGWLAEHRKTIGV